MIMYEVEGSGKIQPVSSLGEEAARHKKPDPSLTGAALHYKQCTRRGRPLLIIFDHLKLI